MRNDVTLTEIKFEKEKLEEEVTAFIERGMFALEKYTKGKVLSVTIDLSGPKVKTEIKIDLGV